MASLSIGQKLWYVPFDRRLTSSVGHEVTVVKVGRKWAEIDKQVDRMRTYAAGRIDIKTMFLDGGRYSSPGRCWLSKADYDREQQRQATWKTVHAWVSGRINAPDNLPISAMMQAMVILTSGEPK
jgi:hypothetical protein